MNDSVSWAVVSSEDPTIAVEFERDGKVQTLQVKPYIATTQGWRRKATRELLIAPAETAIIETVEPKTPAAAAGLQPHDAILSFNGTPLYSPIALGDYIEKHPNEELTLEV